MESNDIPVDILEAVSSDAGEILEIQKLAFYGQGVLYGDFSLPPLLQSQEELARDFRTHVYLKAVLAGSIVGSVRGRAAGGTCHVSRLLVDPAHQGKGIGQALMRAIEERFNGAQRYELFTGHLSEKNLALYRKLGYREFRRERQSDKVMLICMEKPRKEPV
jgi:ribosomal protein S18 acetylase RimI-like enzyme